jgi:CheY-like chemotaxis protein
VTRGTGQVTSPSGTTGRVNARSRSAQSAGNVLIIEDDPNVRSLLGFVLLREGWNVRMATNGADAIALLEQALPDLILLDLSMPGMDGWDVLARRAAESAWRRIPVIVMSADHRQGPLVLELGATGFLPKPFSLDDLRQALLQYLEPPSGESGSGSY